MRHLIAMAVLSGTLAAVLPAQPSHGYVFFAPGGLTCCSHTAMTLHFGVGGEGILGKGVGIGAEVGALGPREQFADGVMGVLSPNGYYHFVHRKDTKIDPFVTGGYTLMFRSGREGLFNLGGGLNYWAGHRIGFRLEFRDHIHTNGSALHFWGMRFGMTFR